MSLDSVDPETFINKENYIVLVSNKHMRNTISILKNTKKAYLLVLSDEPLLSNKKWSVIMQQKFNSHYLALIKKVILNCLVKKICIPI